MMEQQAPKRRFPLLWKGVAGFCLAVLLASPALSNGRIVQRSHDDGRRQLQSIFSPLTRLLELIFPFFRPNQYPMQPVDSFDRFQVCTDLSKPNCDQTNVIKFTNADAPGPTEFKYHDQGPLNMQGVFWAQMTFLDVLLGPTDLLSFAKTRHGGGVQTGVLETDENGYEYVVRPIGDHTWSRERREPDFYLTYFDALYLFDLVEGTLEEPVKFTITPTFKWFFACFRFNFGQMLTSFIFQFDMVHVTDPENEYVMKFPGSVIWERSTLFLSLIPFVYPAIQIIDGSGNPVEPAYTMWSTSRETNFIIGLREDGIDNILQC